MNQFSGADLVDLIIKNLAVSTKKCGDTMQKGYIVTKDYNVMEIDVDESTSVNFFFVENLAFDLAYKRKKERIKRLQKKIDELRGHQIRIIRT